MRDAFCAQVSAASAARSVRRIARRRVGALFWGDTWVGGGSQGRAALAASHSAHGSEDPLLRLRRARTVAQAELCGCCGDFFTKIHFWFSVGRQRCWRHQKFLDFLVLLLFSNHCNFFVRYPLRTSGTALKSSRAETFKNGVSFCLTPPELSARAT